MSDTDHPNVLVKRFFCSSLAGFTCAYGYYLIVGYSRGFALSDNVSVIVEIAIAMLASLPLLMIYAFGIFRYSDNIVDHPIAWCAGALLVAGLFGFAISGASVDTGVFKMTMVVAVPAAFIFCLWMLWRPLLNSPT